MSPRSNSQWIGAVKLLLAEGFGVEDIAQKLGCIVDEVRLEVAILRQEGVLDDMFGGEKCTLEE